MNSLCKHLFDFRETSPRTACSSELRSAELLGYYGNPVMCAPIICIGACTSLSFIPIPGRRLIMILLFYGIACTACIKTHGYRRAQ
ncbi:hypothetical protein C8R41DRAFT_405826 [Lentinula lateritia]|uniref:Uncharacterized protein n=1 Tax=Lentinula lateritia TaxID=40482 RepID=A0ABQ8VI24_9AGAR|nr:hypothetical protein C8R41DRAFT_405826 [Lentinula lateritia]